LLTNGKVFIYFLFNNSEVRKVGITKISNWSSLRKSIQQDIVAKQQASGGWSGKVEEIGDKGEVVGTTYVAYGEVVGEIKGGSSGGGSTYTTNLPENVTTTLSFDKDTSTEKVALSGKQAEIRTGQLQPAQTGINAYLEANPNADTTDVLTTINRNNAGYFGTTTTGGRGGLGTTTITAGERRDYGIGVPIITQQEATRYGVNPATSPVWILSSTDMEGGLREYGYASNLPYYSKSIETTDVRVANLAVIKTGQEIYRQGNAGIELSEEQINTIYSSSVIKARADYSTLPSGTKNTLYVAGLAQGVTSIAIKTGEFMASTALTFGAGRTTYFQFGGTLGEAANYPMARSTGFLASPVQYIKESLSSPAIISSVGIMAVGIGSYASRIGKVGFYEATAEAGSFFSPIKVKGGIYGNVPTSNTEFSNIKSFKSTSPEGITTRVYSGSSGGINLYGAEVFNNKIGGGVAKTTTTITEIRAGGAIIETGRLTTFQPYSFEFGGAGTGFKAKDLYGGTITKQLSIEYPAGISKVITSKGVSVWDFPSKTTLVADFNKGIITTTGGVSSTKGAITQFKSGTASAIYKTTYSGDLGINLDTGKVSRDFLYSPTGSYKSNIKFSGYEVDLNKFYSGTDKGYTSFRGGGANTPYSSTEGGQIQLLKTTSSFNFPTIKTAQAPVQTSPEIPLMVGGLGLSSAELNYQIATRGGGYNAGVQDYTLTSSSVFIIPSITAYGVSQRSGNKNEFGIPAISNAALGLVLNIPAVTTSQIPTITNVPRQNFRLVTGQKLINPYTFGGGNFNINPYVPEIPTTFTTGFPFALGGLSDFTASSIVGGGKRRTGYTPSFSALIFNIKGSYAGGGALGKSGIDFRPIIAGFKFNTGFNTGKIRFKIK
jgi:hypothetical protein